VALFDFWDHPHTLLLYSQKNLCTTVKWLRFHLLARIKFPDEQKMQRFAEMISTREPTISNVIGFMNGLGLATEMTYERIEQNAYYCGYSCDTMVNNVLVFGPNGKVFFCGINYLGSWSDGTLTAHFFSHIKERIGDYKICVDQGFPGNGDASGILVGPIPERSVRQLHPLVRVICFVYLMFTYPSGRQVNGECADNSGPSLDAKHICH
jgi:hypothetical protein